PGHENGATQEYQAGHQSQRIVGGHRCHDVLEAELQLAYFVHAEPQQPLRDSCAPHRQNVEHGTGQREPEVNIGKACAIQLTVEETRHQEVEGAVGNHRIPAECTRVHVPHRPVGEVADDVDTANRHHGPFESGQAIECQREHD